MINQDTNLKGALVTPTFAQDFERCKMLCNSVDRFVTNITRHVLIVDEKDVPLFRCLEDSRTEIIAKESMFDWRCFRFSFSDKWWFTPTAMPVRGWILQQIIKLACAEYLDEDYFVHADSDLVFIRPFDARSMVREGAVRLFASPRIDYKEIRHRNWYRFANKSLGLESGRHMDTEYISPLCCCRKDVLMQLFEHLENRYHRYWKKVLWNTFDFSEYILYGAFADVVLNDEKLHFKSDQQLAYCSWFHPIGNELDLGHFLAHVPDDYLAVHVQSNLHIDPALYRDRILELQKAA